MNTVLIIIFSLVAFLIIMLGLILSFLNPNENKTTEPSSDVGVYNSNDKDSNSDTFDFDFD